MKLKRGVIVALVFVALVISAFVYVNKSYYPMGGEVTIVAKEAQNHDYTITIEQGIAGDAGWGQFILKCTKEQYDFVEVGDVVKCERDQSALTHKGTVHSIR